MFFAHLKRDTKNLPSDQVVPKSSILAISQPPQLPPPSAGEAAFHAGSTQLEDSMETGDHKIWIDISSFRAAYTTSTRSLTKAYNLKVRIIQLSGLKEGDKRSNDGAVSKYRE